jgi:hypothetical protein
MATLTVEFRYLTGLPPSIFRNARLTGNWDAQGRSSDTWSERPMTPDTAEDGCPCFTATVEFAASAVGSRFRWGVRLDGPPGANLWGVPTEVNDMSSTERYREFELREGSPQRQDFYFTYARRLGARKYFTSTLAAPGLRFSVWAPNAQAVEVVFDKLASGYIADDGHGIDPARPVLTLTGASGKASFSPTSPPSGARRTCTAFATPKARRCTVPIFFRATRSAAAARTRAAGTTPATRPRSTGARVAVSCGAWRRSPESSTAPPLTVFRRLTSGRVSSRRTCSSPVGLRT